MTTQELKKEKHSYHCGRDIYHEDIIFTKSELNELLEEFNILSDKFKSFRDYRAKFDNNEVLCFSLFLKEQIESTLKEQFEEGYFVKERKLVKFDTSFNDKDEMTVHCSIY